jgi:hypothetical protein
MSLSALEQQLDDMERQLDVVASALVGAEPAEVQSNSVALQRMAVNFRHMVDACGTDPLAYAHLSTRLQALAESLSSLRENLMRRTAYVEQALQLVIPSTEKTTYAQVSGPYGERVRRTGTFRAFSA